MRRKSLFVTLLLAAVTSVSAQNNAFEGTKFLDNWYIGVNGGGVTKTTHSAFWKNMRGVVGVELGKQITPVLGVSFEGLGSINTSPSRTAFDAMSLAAMGKINLNNLFAGYKGEPRLFEVEALAGIGWEHNFYNSGMRWDDSGMMSRFGASFNFNVGENKAWTVSFKPTIIYSMDGDRAQILNVNNSAIELLAGITYHFKSSNGRHYMTSVRPYDAAEVDALNDKINDLRRESASKDATLAANDATIKNLQQQLSDCQNAPKATATATAPSVESVVAFRRASAAVYSDQLPGIDRIGKYLQDNPSAKVTIKGYASPEGNAKFNERLSQRRANAVKEILVNKYNIDADRIKAEGQGVGNLFSKPNWNRASITTFE